MECKKAFEKWADEQGLHEGVRDVALHGWMGAVGAMVGSLLSYPDNEPKGVDIKVGAAEIASLECSLPEDDAMRYAQACATAWGLKPNPEKDK